MTATPTPARLPRGRHGLSREQVVHSQRGRMRRALAEAMTEKGYAKTSVADVLTRAGVSRETFYEQFSSKEDCFLETFDAVAEIVIALVTATPVVEPATPDERFERLLLTYLEALASEPAYARLYLVEAHAVGPEALRRRAAVQDRFTELLVGLFGARAAHERLACELLVAAIGSMVTTRVALGEHATLPELHAPIVDLVRRGLPPIDGARLTSASPEHAA